MPIKSGTSDPSNYYVGASQVGAIYHGTTKLWPLTATVYMPDYTVQGSPEPNELPPPAYKGCLVSINFAASGNFVAFASYAESVSPAESPWLVSGNAADCQLKVDIVSGSLNSGTTGTWLDLTSDRLYTLSTSTSLQATTVLTCTIRDKATGTVIDSSTITMKVA